MDAAIKEVADGLRAAMQAERIGYEFYKMAARSTSDPAGKATFEQLAREEQEHFDFLRKHYRSLIDNGSLADGVTLGDHPPLTGDSPIFGPSLRERIKTAHFEMSALAIAAQLELNGLQHYREQARKAPLPQARKFFEELAAWESSHYEAMLRQQQLLQDEYWSEAGFDPF